MKFVDKDGTTKMYIPFHPLINHETRGTLEPAFFIIWRKILQDNPIAKALKTLSNPVRQEPLPWHERVNCSVFSSGLAVV